MASENPRKIVLLMDNRFDSNWGSQATSTMLFLGLQARFPKSEIVAIRRTEVSRTRRVFSVGYRLAPLGPSSNWKNPLSHVAWRVLAGPWQHEVADANLVVVNGEGTLHPQRQTLVWMPLLDRIQRVLRLPIWIVNTSIEIEQNSPQFGLFDQVLSRAQRIVVREPYSYRTVVSHGWQCEQGADCAFLAKLDDAPRVDSWLRANEIEGPYAVITGGASSLKWQIDSLRQWCQAIRARGLQLVAMSSTATDDALFRKLGELIPLFSSRDFAFPAAISLIAGAAFHFGGRFHPTIFCATRQVPFICLGSNTHKMAGLMEQLGTQDRLLDASHPEVVLKAIANDSFHSLEKSMGERVANLRVLCDNNFQPPTNFASDLDIKKGHT